MPILDQVVIIPVVDDMDDEELIEQLKYYLDAEDYEYCDCLVIEMNIRGIDVVKVLSKY